ncbi:ORF6N domain-containing protein [Escherichia coli]|uniref:ORF6N domain-containing protein n=1 Tax=Escherichia coli TaxID=562 RepID=UPI00085437C5|nr:ORF6N domain-containing protein [Escherichia coli]EFG1298956.1 ORF6N domain-containing protein [Escherichia coli]EFI2164232.1 ORF6N domain-containing protein [Escherichia coli]EGC4770983.1 ORF6N domain-containing protein [Escherichia coli]EHJ7923370.1 ORF6N domain-containing protein [Escherichia coli]EHN9962893.1 ORF6N domain-containing protein [Escherichia coli]
MTVQISVDTLPAITHNQIPVITTELLAKLYGTKIKNISDNFLNNTTRFVVGKHYFKIEKSELREFKDRPETIGLVGKNARSLILWTERGAARHAKMLETDQAWEVFEKLEDCYFSQKQPPAAQNSPTQNDGCALLIHFDKHGQVEFTEKVPADAMVCTLERFKFYLEQHGWIVARKEQLVERLMRI